MDIRDIARSTISELVDGYRQKRISPVAVMEATIEQIGRVNPKLNAIYDLRPEASLAAAQEAAERYRTETPAGALDGVPVSIKDSISATGMTWHHGARLHGSGRMGTADAPPTQRLKRANAIIFGKATMPDFGLSGSGVSSYHGIARNPWGLSWNPGGSSAGAGASLAAGIGMMSVGTDIAGSVRLPASHCGLAALKPTQGMIAHTPASDVCSAGPMTRYAADLELALRVLGGVHADDRYSVPLVEPTEGFEGARVVVYETFGMGPAVEKAVTDVLQAARLALEPLVRSVRDGKGGYDFDAYLPMDDSFKLAGWREYQGAPADLRAETPQQMFDWFYEASQWGRDRIAQVEADLARGIAQTVALFGDADFLLTPVMPVVNFPAEDRGIERSMPLRHCTFTAPFNQSGHPAAAIFGGLDPRGLPVGVQLVAKRFDDIRLCRLAAALERAIWDRAPHQREWPLEPRA